MPKARKKPINAAPDWTPAPTRTARPRLVQDTVEDVEASPSGPVKVRRKVQRRARSAALDKAAPVRVKAAEEYAAAYEAAKAGGVGAPLAGEKIDGGPAATEGRQSSALDLVERLGRLDGAIGGEVVHLDARGAHVSYRMIVRAVAVAGASVSGLLDALDVRRTTARERAILASPEGPVGLTADTVATAE